MKMLDPLKIPQKNFPLIVMVDDRRSFLGFAIKSHSKGNYSHIMDFCEQGICATQSPLGFKKIAIKRYMKDQFQLKVWYMKGLSVRQKREYIEMVAKELKQPWWKRMYDFPGVLGQMLPGRWTRKFNIPWLRYCSERVAEHIRKILRIKVTKHLTPAELNQFFKDNPTIFGVYGYWFVD